MPISNKIKLRTNICMVVCFVKILLLHIYSLKFANGFDHFRFHRAAFNALFAGVFGQANRLHRFISSKTR